MHTAKYFWIDFTIKLKRNNLRHQLKKYMLKENLKRSFVGEIRKQNYIK
jgi:hypothetical protein